MKFGFEFSNLCGTVYQGGNLLFTPDGRTLISPVGNRITVFDLVNHVSTTLPFQTVHNITNLAISEDSAILLVIDEIGRGLVINFPRKVVISTINLGAKIRDLKFSPDGKYIAVAKGDVVEIITPPTSNSRNFDIYRMKHRIVGHCNEVVQISWSRDSRFVVSSSRDMTARVHLIDSAKVKSFTLAGHKDQLRAAFFGEDDHTIYTIGRDGFVMVWKWAVEVSSQSEDGEENTTTPRSKGKWTYAGNHFFNKPYAKATCASYHASKNIIVIGFSDGIFGVYEMPTFTNIHTLSMSKHRITTTSINSSGDWLAFGCSELGQLLVWEWTSESYILKQQGHTLDINSVAYSPDGQFIVTGSDDGKVKAWNSSTGFCFVTFSEHTAPVKAVAFLPSGNAVVSASLDGTVRAFDLIRYRNYRTFTTPEPRQFTTIAVDPSGDIVCAGTQDDFSIAVWSMQNGRLLEVLSGHEGPVSTIAFHPLEPILASGSWDKTLRLWDVFEGKSNREAMLHTHEILSLAFNSQGTHLCAASMDGSINIWDPNNGNQIGVIEGRRDIHNSHPSFVMNQPKNLSSNKYFSSISFSVDGSCIIAGGNSSILCIYHVEQRVLVKKFLTNRNIHFRGTLVQPSNSNGLRIFDGSDDEKEKDHIPGVKKGDFGDRKVKPELRTNSVAFSPTGRSWAAATTEGLLIYSLDNMDVFDPLDLELDITPENIKGNVASKNYARSILMALRLNDKSIIQATVESVPVSELPLVTKQISYYYLPSLMLFLSDVIGKTKHIEFYLVFVRLVFNTYGKYIRENSAKFMGSLRNMHKNMIAHQEEILKLNEDNKYALEYIINVSRGDLYETTDESLIYLQNATNARKTEKPVGGAGGMEDDENDDAAFISNFDISAGMNMFDTKLQSGTEQPDEDEQNQELAEDSQSKTSIIQKSATQHKGLTKNTGKPSTKQQLESDEEEENDDEDFDENDNVAQESPEEDEIQADSVKTEEPTAKSGSQKRGKGVVKPTKAGTKTQVIKPAISKKKIMATPEKKKKPKKA